jgi:hypothetical protein
MKPSLLTGRGDQYGRETSRLPHFADNLLTDGGEVVSLTSRSHFTPQEDSWYLFMLDNYLARQLHDYSQFHA